MIFTGTHFPVENFSRFNNESLRMLHRSRKQNVWKWLKLIGIVALALLFLGGMFEITHLSLLSSIDPATFYQSLLFVFLVLTLVFLLAGLPHMARLDSVEREMKRRKISTKTPTEPH